MPAVDVPGADSEFPQPTEYRAGRRWWGVYVAGYVGHIWSVAEVRGLAAAGIEYCLPIVAGPPVWPWLAVPAISQVEAEAFQHQEKGAGLPEVVDLAAAAADGEVTVLRELIAEAQAWGVPAKGPLCLDVEEAFAELVGTNLASLLSTWSLLCEEADLEPWVYGSARTLSVAGSRNHKWLAWWPAPVPVAPEVPVGYHAWQYAGNQAGGRIDLDVMLAPRVLMSTAGRGAVILGGEHPEPAKPTMADFRQDLANAAHAIGQARATLEAL